MAVAVLDIPFLSYKNFVNLCNDVLLSKAYFLYKSSIISLSAVGFNVLNPFLSFAYLKAYGVFPPNQRPSVSALA